MQGNKKRKIPLILLLRLLAVIMPNIMSPAVMDDFIRSEFCGQTASAVGNINRSLIYHISGQNDSRAHEIPPWIWSWVLSIPVSHPRFS